MAYQLESFIDTILPVGNPTTDISPIRARTNVIQTMAGAYDPDAGNDTADELPHQITYRALSDGNNYAQWRAAEDAFRALVGKRGRLWRRAEDDSTVQWALCRLIALPGQRGTRDILWKEDTFEFQQIAPWRGRDHREWILDDGEFLDTGLYLNEVVTYTYSHPMTLVINNGGNARVTDAIITITAGSVPITATRIIKSGQTDMQFAGTIAAGQSLVIDTGSYSVLNNGNNGYGQFNLLVGHLINEWLRLEPGDNTLEINLTATDYTSPPTISVVFMDAWK